MPQSPNSDSAYTEWRYQARDGLTPLQSSLVPLFEETQLFRLYSSTLMPGLLQTEGYAAAVLRAVVAELPELPFDDSAEAARARVERSRVVHDPERRFDLLFEESVLSHQLGDAEVMAAQLDYLLTGEALSSVSLGVIPMARERTHLPQETFHVYDDDLVSVELVSAEMKISQPSEIALYLRVFEQLRSMAVYGVEARALIRKALGSLG
ncbi:DUF5753 domain-containing protein [Streptomyces angustmyceticus]|uniref:DUF5753 domain-containing protein n=1 Tax=Streptomyces angustmyceticus TaxID=285578 RepID=UPI003814F32F